MGSPYKERNIIQYRDARVSTIKCSVQINSLGKETLENNDNPRHCSSTRTWIVIELVKRVFLAMQEFPARNRTDWASQVTQEEISKMYKYKFKFKKIVKKQITQKACEYLTELQMKHSKSLNLQQESDMKEYLCSTQ